MLIYAVLTAVFIAALFMIKSEKPLLRNIGKIAVLLYIGAGFLILCVMLIFTLAYDSIRVERDTALIMTAFAIIYIIIACCFFKKTRRKAVLLPLAAALVVCICIGGYSAYENSLLQVSDGYSLGDYSPYISGKEGAAGEKLALLDGPSSFTVSGKLPRIDGATALYPVYSAFFRAAYPKIAENNWNRYITCSTTAGAYKSLVVGGSDIIFVAGASQEQAEYARENGVELVFTPIGSEAFVFIVNEKNPLSDISPEQIRDIYSGKISRWEELGVKRFGEIKAFQREEGSGSQTAFESMIMSRDELMEAPTEQKADLMSGMYEKVADYRNYKGAIGYSFRFYCTQMFSGKGIKLLSVNGIAPTVENIENGSYPYAGNFYAVTRSDADENVKAFLEWMCGEEGQSLVEKTGYTPIIKTQTEAEK